MSWTFEQSTGNLYDPSGNFAAKGYSGAPGFTDNPSDQELKDRGVIPQGIYSMGPPFDGPAHGQFAIPLTPDPKNQEFGRGGFMIHGDSIARPGCASMGCIIMPYATRITIWDSRDHTLQVVAKFTRQLPEEPEDV
jgi:hypothetical protein